VVNWGHRTLLLNTLVKQWVISIYAFALKFNPVGNHLSDFYAFKFNLCKN
jgi:hypothetical protein